MFKLCLCIIEFFVVKSFVLKSFQCKNIYLLRVKKVKVTEKKYNIYGYLTISCRYDDKIIDESLSC